MSTGSPSSISLCLWYDGQAEQAARLYTSLLPNSRIDRIDRAPSDYPSGKQGDALLVHFTLDGRSFQAMNGGPGHPFTDATSLSVIVETQAELDRLWDALITDGGAPVACGWLKDRWGLSWQIVPRIMMRALNGDDPAATKRTFDAMTTMVKLDVAALEAAYRGDTA